MRLNSNCILSVISCFLLLFGSQSHAERPPLFPDFDISLRRYNRSDRDYDHFFNDASPECRQTVNENRRFKKFLRNLYQENKLKRTKEKRVRIPKVIHQIWLGSPVPEFLKEWMQTWQGWNGWTYKLWTDEDADNYGLYNKKLYDSANNYAERSDILRYEILYREGGLYVDVDFICKNRKFFDYAHTHYDLYLGVEPLETKNLSTNNALLGCAPDHPLMKSMIYDMEEHYAKAYDPSLGEYSTIATTGPRYLTKQFKNKKNHRGKIDIALPPTFFYPQIWDDLKQSQEKQDLFLKPESCATHQWSGTWHGFSGRVKRDELFGRTDPKYIGKLYQMLKVVDEVARKKDIRYWMDAGTLLGAVRHKGIIPWDDDVELMIFETDREKLMALAPEFEKYGFYLKDCNTVIRVFPSYTQHYPFIDILTVEHEPGTNDVVLSHPQVRESNPKEYFRHDEIETLVEMPFGPLKIFAPSNPMRFLTEYYGPDCMKKGLWWNQVTCSEQIAVELVDFSPAAYVLVDPEPALE